MFCTKKTAVTVGSPEASKLPNMEHTQQSRKNGGVNGGGRTVNTHPLLRALLRAHTPLFDRYGF